MSYGPLLTFLLRPKTSWKLNYLKKGSTKRSMSEQGLGIGPIKEDPDITVFMEYEHFFTIVVGKKNYYS